MNITEKLAPIRKGLLEFVILKIVAGDKVYVADMLKRLGPTELATHDGTLYALLSKLRRARLVACEWQESDAGPARKYSKLAAKRRTQLTPLTDYGTEFNRTLA